MRIFFHQKNDSPMCHVNWFWLPLFMMITPYLSWRKTPTRKQGISTPPFDGKVTNKNSWTSRSQNRRHLSLWRLLHFPKKKHEPLKTSLVQREKQHRRCFMSISLARDQWNQRLARDNEIDKADILLETDEGKRFARDWTNVSLKIGEIILPTWCDRSFIKPCLPRCDY